jgi:microcystin-dependent protein
MAQADQVVQNNNFPTVRADINNNLAALFSNSSGGTSPTVTVAYQDWIDTSGTDPIWKKRNAANSAWITIGALTSTGFEGGGVPSGTAMLFQQTSAPTGWTKSTTHDNKALRVVSGSAGSGGSSAFTDVLNGSVDATTLTTSQIPSHTHNLQRFNQTLTGSTIASSQASTNAVNITPPTAATGGGGSHTHSMDVAYVDVIIATKN